MNKPKKRSQLKPLQLNRPPSTGRHGWSDGGAHMRRPPAPRTYKSRKVL